MYQSYNLIESVAIINRILVDAEMQRNNPERHLRYREVGRQGPLAAVRRAAGRGLIALGTRLDPAAGMPAAAASGLRA